MKTTFILFFAIKLFCSEVDEEGRKFVTDNFTKKNLTTVFTYEEAYKSCVKKTETKMYNLLSHLYDLIFTIEESNWEETILNDRFITNNIKTDDIIFFLQIFNEFIITIVNIKSWYKEYGLNYVNNVLKRKDKYNSFKNHIESTHERALNIYKLFLAVKSLCNRVNWVTPVVDIRGILLSVKKQFELLNIKSKNEIAFELFKFGNLNENLVLFVEALAHPQ